ncbi:ammonia-forming cytochrome c nitrite reductase subunit c552 [Peristeroidobacter soli]|uniref:ammonia-forming cytochrome c nitrite reductase subunit c552 n=1 Tax=Peristeroidobacter soli TaxID=2497877 RepID=UPI001C37B22D|nr:ammonia-forming cytochrome c nitrite reductase subunit c552 [Peristeroidobacter soli]
MQRVQASSADFVGGAACAGCHRAQYESWRGSHHDLAMQPADDPAVLGDFENAALRRFGGATRFFRRGEEYWVETDNAQGKPEAFKIEYTFGAYPLQQYLVAFPSGRYQALTAAWDSRPKAQGGQRWFDLQAGERVRHDDPLHWTGPYYNWNSRCAECHSTGLRKNYDAAQGTYATTWTDIDVACEACHGAGSEHVKWAKDPNSAAATSADKGLVIDVAAKAKFSRAPGVATAQATNASLSTAQSSRQLDACGPCHSRRQVLVSSEQKFRMPAYHQAYSLSLPMPPTYHADGQILDEDYELGSFLQSKMHARGVVCSNCHDPHSLKLRATDNDVCAQCHDPGVFDRAAHHHHAAGSKGAECANCHMPVTTYMVVDDRRDHSIRIPRPDLSVKYGMPNACGQCHAKQGPKWAAARVEDWRRSADKEVARHFSDLLTSADDAAWLQLAADSTMPGIARAAALSSLGQRPSSNTLHESRRYFSDSDPLVRRAATEGFEAVDPAQRLQMLRPLAGDPSKSVRMQVAPLLSAIDTGGLAAEQRTQLVALFSEYVASMRANADMPGNLVNLGLFYVNRREAALAESAYRDALRLDRQFIPAYLNLADLYRQLQREGDARVTLDQALDLAPDAAAVHYAMGLQQVRSREYDEALKHLKRAHELSPSDVTYGYVYAVALFEKNSPDRAIDVLKRLSAQHPENDRVAQALSDFLDRRGRSARKR